MENSQSHDITHTNISTRYFMQILYISMVVMGARVRMVEGVWCVARSDASDQVLQSALDYACAAGADCSPIQESGMCFLPNTLQAHASYAFNSFFQRNHMSSGSCDFSKSATLAKTDPSYGSCVYPASPSTAGSITPTTTGTTPVTNPYVAGSPFGRSPLTPTISSPTIGGGSGLNSGGMGPPIPTTSDSTASRRFSVASALLLQTLVLLYSIAIL